MRINELFAKKLSQICKWLTTNKFAQPFYLTSWYHKTTYAYPKNPEEKEYCSTMKLIYFLYAKIAYIYCRRTCSVRRVIKINTCDILLMYFEYKIMPNAMCLWEQRIYNIHTVKKNRWKLLFIFLNLFNSGWYGF